MNYISTRGNHSDGIVSIRTMSTILRPAFSQALDSKYISHVTVEERSDDDSDSFNQKTQSSLLIINLKDPLKLIHSHPIPELKSHDILVRNRAVGINPIDWKGKRYGFGIYHFPWINGRESSGDIVQKGYSVGGEFDIGDKVIISSTSYRDNRTSTFQEFTAIDSRLVWKLPTSFSYEDGATIGVGLVTAGVILYQSFGFDLVTLPKATATPKSILIWGGATVVGIFITQLAKLHGLQVISVADSKNEAYLKNLGAHHVIDRYLDTDRIIEYATKIAKTTNGIQYGVDCISEETSRLVIKILEESVKGNFNDGANISKELNTQNSTIPLFAGIVGVPKVNSHSVDIRPVVVKTFHEDLSFGKKYVDITSQHFENNKLKPVRFKQYKGGIHKIENALKDLEVLGAKGEKYVVSL